MGCAASRILFFARTIRCAIVGAGTRNARAMSSVVSPQTSRSVSAICASSDSAGWQQTKISRSRSSSRSPSGSSGSAASTRQADRRPRSSAASKRARRRSASIALKRPDRDRARSAGCRARRRAAQLFDRGREGLVQRLLSAIEIAEQPDQGRENATRLLAVDGLDRRREPRSARGSSVTLRERQPVPRSAAPRCCPCARRECGRRPGRHRSRSRASIR